MSNRPDPYNGFKNDTDRRLALRHKETMGVVKTVLPIILLAVMAIAFPEALPALLKWRP